MTQIYLASLGNLKLRTDGVMIPQTQDDSIIMEYKCHKKFYAVISVLNVWANVSVWLAIAVTKIKI